MKRLFVFAFLCLLFAFSCTHEPDTISVTNVTLSSSSVELVEGDSFQLEATVSPSNATNTTVIWSSSNASVATVDRGKIMAHKPGNATITVTSDDGGKKATCNVTVTAKVIPVFKKAGALVLIAHPRSYFREKDVERMDALREMLAAACQLLKPGGRLSVITYHSLEDRLVKNVMRTGNVEGRTEQDFFGRTNAVLKTIGKVITPSEEEIARNPRSRSAKLRVAEKI